MASYYNKYQRSWRPVSIADANRYSVAWSRRIDAQDKLDELMFEHQAAAASCALGRRDREPCAYLPPTARTRTRHAPVFSAG